MKLKVKGTYILSLTKYPGEEQPTQVLLVAGILTPPIAEKLKVREGCYTDEGVPRHYDSYPSPAVRINGADVFIGERDYRANLIHKFKVAQPKNGGETDTSLEVRFRMHFDGKVPLHAVVDNLNKTEFVLGINARQEDLNFGEEEAGEEDSEDEEPDLGCIACNNSMGFMPDSDTVHESGQKCTRKREATLAPAAVMGGTRQRKGRTPAEVQ